MLFQRPIFFLLLLFILILVRPSYAVVELGGDFGHDKKVYGTNRQNQITTRTYSGTMAFYFFIYTALEFSYTHSEEITNENDTILIPDTDYSVVSLQNKVISDTYGIGLRQALAPSRSPVVPMISLGYANQQIKYGTDLTFHNSVSGQNIIVEGDISKKREDSVFGAFILKIHLLRGFSIKGSVKTIFPAFEFNKARDDVRYLIGFSWMF